MITEFIILTLENITNVFIDAYKIRKLNKPIRHGINFAVYAIFVAGLIWSMHMPWWMAIIFCINAFCNRQLFFDIPLNLKRGLKWDYVTSADPPAAIMDRIEIKIFGRDGKTPVKWYAGIWVATSLILLLT